MKLRVLGCSGGIGGRHLRTTSLLLEDSVLIDAGTGVGDLSLAELARIDHVFVTHSHLDHVTSIPFLVDTVCTIRSAPITVHATAATIAILREHLFNDLVWPDFNRIPSREAPYLRYQEIALGKASAAAGCQITPLPAVHTVPAVGFLLDSGRASVVFTGDTGPNAALWQAVNRIGNLKALIIETAFSNGERDLAERSKHLCPSMLAAELANLEGRPEVWITHLKPGEIELTMQEVEQAAGAFRPRMLQNGQTIEF
jgi:ribonuclease BN (tRNA processing enzyme)